MKNSIVVLLLMTMLNISSCELIGSPDINIKKTRLVHSRALIGVASAYLIINNIGNGSDTLTGCFLKNMPSVRCRLHDVIDGKMVLADELNIPAGKTVYLEKGFKHLMLYGLPGEIENEVLLILNFKKSGQLSVKVGTDTG